MSRIRFDQLAKQYLEDFLEPLGTIQRNLEVPGEPKFVDLWFTPTAPTLAIDIGLLSRIATTACLLEPFRNAPTRQEIRSCLLKLLWLQEDQRRTMERERRKQSEQDLTKLWVLAATISQPVVTEFGGALQADWGDGVYHLPTAHKTAIVAIDQLPLTPETLWLRILGRDQVQQQAIAELLALPRSDQRRDRVLQLLINWRVTIELSELRDDNEEGTLMVALSQAYLEWEQARIQQGLQQGLQQGIQQGVEHGIQQGIERERSLILRQLIRKIEALPGWTVLPINHLSLTQLESLGEALLDFTTTTDLVNWLLTCRLGDLPEQVTVQVAQLLPVQLELLVEALENFTTAADLADWLDAVDGNPS